ncbi:hypothetical protein EV714DRAFT_270906 [Schizophyllum commune]
MARTKHPSREPSASPGATPNPEPKKFIFTAPLLNRLCQCTLNRKPWDAQHREVDQAWQDVTAQFNKGLRGKKLTAKTAREKISTLLKIRRQGREPTQELRVAFEGGDEALFSALLDRLVKEYDDAKERKAAKSAKRAKELEEREAAGARVRERGTMNLVLTNATRERRQAAQAGDAMPPTTAEPSLSTPPAAPLAINHVPAATGPLHDFLSQFMSVQNRVTEQQAQLDRELLHMLIEEEKKQTKLLEQILNVAMGLTYTAPRGLSLDATPIHGPALSLSPIPPYL